MASDLQGMRDRAGGSDPRYERARERLRQTQQASLDRRAKRRSDDDKNRLQRELAAQDIKAQRDRDKRQFGYDTSLSTQRAFQQADAEAAEFRNRRKLNEQEQKGTLKRDSMQQRFESAQARQRALEQQRRDERQFGYGQLEAQQAFENQMARDSAQNVFTNQRDFMQYGYDTLRSDQQQAQQRERDTLLNQFSAEQDSRQQSNMLERARLDQQFTQQNMYQRQAEEISAKWQEQVATAKNSGLDFSERQKKEMKDLDAAFRKNVLNGPYSDTLKQQAMVEHQKKLAAIVPEEKVVNPKEVMDSSIMLHEPTNTWFMQQRDSKGNLVFEPLGSNGPDMSALDKQAQQQQQLQLKQKEAARDAEFDRLEKFDKLVNAIRTEEIPGEGGLRYPDEQAVMAEAMKRFEPYEKSFQQNYGLPPLAPYQAKMDQERAAEAAAIEAEKARRQQAIDAVKPDPAKAARMNPWQQMLQSTGKKMNPPGTSHVNTSRPAGIDHSDPLNDTSPPVLISTKDLDWTVSTRLGHLPGGLELGKLRDRHNGKDPKSQTVRLAADIVINSMIMKDDSDPDLVEAYEVLKQAGYKPPAGKK